MICANAARELTWPAMHPPDMAQKKSSSAAFSLMIVATTVLFVVAINVIFLRAPTERTMGVVQKIFYFHVPSAYCMYLAAAACFVGSLGYLIRPSNAFDALGRAGAELATVFGAIVLTTGPLWAAKAWGYYWTWDPRLTTSLLSVMIYVAYLVLRAFAGDGEGERKFAAALGVIGAANLPIIHFSVQKWSGQHPTVITAKGGGLRHPDMILALTLSFIAFTLLAIALLWVRVRLELARQKVAEIEQDALDIGIELDSYPS